MEKTFFISADIEGITDVTFWSETEEGQEGYVAARAQMTREAVSYTHLDVYKRQSMA